MSGVRRLIVGEITHSNVRGKGLGDVLARELNSEERAVSNLKKKMNKPNKKNYGKKK